jgi:hypothetical protein
MTSLEIGNLIRAHSLEQTAIPGFFEFSVAESFQHEHHEKRPLKRDVGLQTPAFCCKFCQFGNSATGYMKSFKTGVDPIFRIRISLAPTLALPLGIDAVLCVVE